MRRFIEDDIRNTLNSSTRVASQKVSMNSTAPDNQHDIHAPRPSYRKHFQFFSEVEFDPAGESIPQDLWWDEIPRKADRTSKKQESAARNIGIHTNQNKTKHSLLYV